MLVTQDIFPMDGQLASTIDRVCKDMANLTTNRRILKSKVTNVGKARQSHRQTGLFEPQAIHTGSGDGGHRNGEHAALSTAESATGATC
jgi:hypothetical protein